MLTRATSTSIVPTADKKRNTPLSARVRPLSKLLRLPFLFLLDFDLRETSFAGNPRAFFSSEDYNTTLFWTIPT